jgi:hypothetical protein
MKSLSLRKAMDLMQLSNTRLVCMHTGASPDGMAHYLIPGGYVEPWIAEKIKQHPGVIAGKDGLFPDHDQTWRMGVD